LNNIILEFFFFPATITTVTSTTIILDFVVFFFEMDDIFEVEHLTILRMMMAEKGICLSYQNMQYSKKGIRFVDLFKKRSYEQDFDQVASSN